MDEKMEDVGSGNLAGTSESETSSAIVLRSNIFNREDVENFMDSGAPNAKMTSVDSGIETGNDSNDSAVVPVETRELSIISDDGRVRKLTYSPMGGDKWNLEMHEICQPFSSMSADAIEAACSGSKTYQPSSSSLSRTTCGPLVPFDKTRIRPLTQPRLTLVCQARRITYKNWNASSARRKVRLMKAMGYGGDLGERRLRCASASNNVEQVERLLVAGTDPNSCDEQKRTPLHLSAGRGYTDIVRLLLRYGANPSAKDCIGNTPLHLAAVTSKISVVTLLLEAGCDPLSPDLHGYNPLQLAETKLRLLQNCKGDDMLRIKSEVHEVVSMLVAYMKNRNALVEQVDALSNFCSRLTLSNTSNQVQDDVRDLLFNIDALNLKS